LKLPKVNGYYLWLLPDDSTSEIYRTEINRLASNYNSIPFEPHITISSLPDREPEELNKILQKICKKINSFIIDFNNAVYGEHPYQKITLPARPTAEFTSICHVIDSVLDGDFSKKTFPHLSLLYGYQPRELLLDELEAHKNKSFPPATIKYLALYKLEGLPNHWQLVRKIELS